MNYKRVIIPSILSVLVLNVALCNVERGSETSLCLIQWLGILISIVVTQEIVKNIEN